MRGQIYEVKYSIFGKFIIDAGELSYLWFHHDVSFFTLVNLAAPDALYKAFISIRGI